MAQLYCRLENTISQIKLRFITLEFVCHSMSMFMCVCMSTIYRENYTHMCSRDSFNICIRIFIFFFFPESTLLG